MNIEVSKYPGLRPLPPDFVREYPPLAVVIEEDCIACNRCLPLCFFEAIVMEDRPSHKFKRTAIVIPDNCTGCGLCFEACPVDAFVWEPDKNIGQGPSKASQETERDLGV